MTDISPTRTRSAVSITWRRGRRSLITAMNGAVNAAGSIRQSIAMPTAVVPPASNAKIASATAYPHDPANDPTAASSRRRRPGLAKTDRSARSGLHQVAAVAIRMRRGKIPTTAAVWLANQLSREETVMEEQQERDRRRAHGGRAGGRGSQAASGRTTSPTRRSRTRRPTSRRTPGSAGHSVPRVGRGLRPRPRAGPVGRRAPPPAGRPRRAEGRPARRWPPPKTRPQSPRRRRRQPPGGCA